MTATATRQIVIPYTPRPLQRVIHEALDRSRWAVAVCHRRFGKTVLAINQILKRAVTCQRWQPRYAYVAPFRTQAKDIAWSYLKHYAAPLLAQAPSESELRVDLITGAQIRLYGADNEDALRGLYLDGVVLDEYGQMSPTLWGEVIRPLLSDRQGWAFVIGTPNGRNQFYELIYGSRDGSWPGALRDPSWFVAIYRASETGVLSEAELADARRTMTEDQYLQEYECSFEAAVKGAVYARELAAARAQGRITTLAADPRLPVDTAWDLGMDDATAIWFAQTTPSGDVRLLAYYESHGQGLPHYVRVLREYQQTHGWVYGDHFLPHDVEVKDLGTGVSRLETLHSLGLCSARPVPRTPSLDDDINAVRMLLPRCWFHEPGCAQGIDALTHYRWKEPTAHQTGRTLPVHDWASHGADALRTLACAPTRRARLLAEWDRRRHDHDPADALVRPRRALRIAGTRGGW